MSIHIQDLPRSIHSTPLRACLVWLVALGLASLGWAGGTGTTELLAIQGEGATRAQGDYVSDSGGIGSYYSFYIEVPPSASRLVVDIFDADIGIGGGTEETANRDEIRGTADTTATYSLRDPSGSVRTTNFTIGNISGPASSDNAWLSLFDSASSESVSFEGVETELDGSFPLATSITVDIPGAPCATGDLLLAAIATDGTVTVTTPTGWTLINGGSSGGGGGQAATLYTFYRIASGGDIGGSQTFTYGSSEQTAGGILCYGGVDSSDPLDGIAAATGQSDSPTAPSVTTTVDATRVVRLYVADDNDTSGSPYPSGHAGRYNIATSIFTAGEVTTGAADITQGTAGATGGAAFDLSASEHWRALTIALAPDSSDASLLPGHWELRIDQSGSSGNDINAIGIRAHDGTSGAGGVELNVYAESFTTYGTNNAGGSSGSRSYTHHPYVTSGCDLEAYNFDWDSTETGSQGSMGFDTRTGTSLTGVTDASMSGNDVWTSPTVTAWTDGENATEYGIWDMDVTITGWPNNGNYGQILLSDETGIGGGDPNAQPEANSHDIYFATDAGAAPVKPYLEQLLRIRDGEPNPPNTGDTSRMTVTVRIVNPTPHSITFSASNLVTANIPGSGVVYAGNASVSQGSIVSQPSVGGTGDITWNPGTVTTGSTELLAYDVDVTPTSNGQTLAVTGTPSSNGTTASYVDETCTGAAPACSGAQLTRATPTLGPLCELEVTEDQLTYVKIDRFASYFDRDGLVIEWVSASEAGTMMYELWRAHGEKWVPVEGGQIPALYGAPQGGVYRVIDPDGSQGDQYVIRERDRRGEASLHGPFVAHSAASLERPMDGMVSATPRVAERSSSGLESRFEALQGGGDQGRGINHQVPDRSDRRRRAAAPSAVDLLIRETGLYHLSATQISGSLGLSQAQVQSRIAQGTLALETAGEPVAWTPAPGDTGLYFYGEAIDSLYTLDNVYRLRATSGNQMAVEPVAPSAPDPGVSYAAQQWYEEDAFAALVLGLDPATDYWFWSAMTAGAAGFDTWDTVLPASELGTGDGELTVRLLGATTTGPGGEHEVDLFLGGHYLTTATWSGAEQLVTVPLSAGDLLAGGNGLTLQAHLPSGASQSIVFIDSVGLTYDRHYVALDDELAFGADGNGTVSLSGFSGTPIVLEINDPKSPVLLSGGTSFEPKTTNARYFAAGPGAIREVTSVRTVSSQDVLAAPADMILLVPGALEHAADDLMGHRQNEGLSVARVTVQSVMDQFNHGIFDPWAIRDFLIEAESKWGVAPSYLTLVGTGSYDYRNLLGNGDQLMPPLFAATENGLYTADDLYGDLDGDGAVEVRVGRIPAASYADVWSYSQKVIAYESGEPSSELLFVSDEQRAGEAIDFGAENDLLRTRFEGLAETVQLDLDVLGIETLREELLAELDTGPAFVNYFGHGAADVWGDAGILTLADLPALDGGSAVYTGLTCLMNRFEVVGFDSLGAQLLFADGGAVASWSPTAPETHALSRAVGQEFYLQLASHDWSSEELRLGDLVSSVKSQFGPSAGLQTYLLLGDPALRLRFSPLVADPVPSGPETE